MNRKNLVVEQALKFASVAAVSALFLTGCGQATDASGSKSVESNTEASETNVDINELLAQRDDLAASLGDGFVQSWITDGKLNVSVTKDVDGSAAKSSGAVVHVVDYSAAQLREGITNIMKWQAELDDPLRTSIYGYSLNPSNGGLALSADPSHLEELKKKLQADKPAGDIPVEFREGTGLATPAATN